MFLYVLGLWNYEVVKTIKHENNQMKMKFLEHENFSEICVPIRLARCSNLSVIVATDSSIVDRD